MLALLGTASQTIGSGTGSNSNEGFPITVLVFFSVLFVYIIAGSAFEHFELHYLHETGLAILLGGIVGFGYFAYNEISDSETIKPFPFDEQSFFNFLLPPIIFSSGYSLKTRKFFAYIPYTLLFGIVGTFLNFVTAAGLTYLAYEAQGVWIIGIPGKLTFKDILLYSATICSSDTVAAASLIKYKDYPKLYSVVFGEGLANDAVSIILTQTVAEIFADESKISWFAPLSILGHFASLASLSILLGIVLGIFSAVFMRKATFMLENPPAQLLSVFGFGYLSYIISDICHLSGIITLLITAIVMSHYTFYNLSQAAQISTGSTFNALSLIAEGFIFMHLGLSAFFYTSDDWSITLILIEIVIIFVSRFVGIFVLSWLAKACSCLSKWKLTNRELAVIWFAGMVRGSIAFGLILKVRVDPLLRSTVLALVLITTVVLGALMPTFIYKMIYGGGTLADSSEPRSREETQHDTLKMMEDHIYKFKNREYGNRLHFYWRVFDDTFMKPWLIRDFDPETQKLKKKLKFDEFGAGRLNLHQQLFQSEVQKPAHNNYHHEKKLSAPLLNRNLTSADFGEKSDEYRFVVDQIKPDPHHNGYPFNGSSIVVSNSIPQKSKGEAFDLDQTNSHYKKINQVMELGRGFTSRSQEEKSE